MGEDGNTTENTPTAVAQAIEDVEDHLSRHLKREIITLDTGNTAWMITATALVLFMTLPGLALFYGGLVQSKNVLVCTDAMFFHCLLGLPALGSLWLQPVFDPGGK